MSNVVLQKASSLQEIKAAMTSFSRSRAQIGSVVLPKEGGVYAIYLSTPGLLPRFCEGEERLIYIGLSRCLADREIEQHFATGATGFSTLRRSLGAMLKEHLLLTAIPRAGGPSESNVRNYCFAKNCELALTNWMNENLKVGVYITPRFKELESDLVSHLKPALNLTKWPNPFRREIKEFRRRCADEARQARCHKT